MFARFVRQWWNEPVDYSGQVEYFAKRAMAGAIQVLIGVGTGLNAVISLVILLPFAGSLAAHFVVAAFAVLQFFWAWMFCYRPWPTRSASLTFVISADIGIAAVALVDANWLLGLFGFNAFAMISVYLMFFDGPKVLAGHVIWLLLTTTAFAARVAVDADFDTIAFTASTLTAVVPVAATPLGIQLGIWAMRNDANEAVTDPLTGLLNRRGLHLHLGNLLRHDTTMHTEVAVMVVDLDRFKDINDTFGHSVGDEVLIRSARRIKSAVRGSALVARIGGEEFVIVDLVEPGGHLQPDFDRVRRSIAAPADRTITASAGVTSVAVAGFALPGADPVALLERIIGRADHAMFDAKRHGGNATIHFRATDDQPCDDLALGGSQVAGVPSGQGGTLTAERRTMARTDDDTWDITESVGATALVVAAARAAEHESAQPLFSDPFARVFLDAAGQGTWNMFDSAAVSGVDSELAARMRALQDFFASRTAFIDDFFGAAAQAGVRQVVILAAGLDARAWRLAWPDGTHVYELDQPRVLDFKSSTLAAHGAAPTAQRIEVAVDLRQDWPTALRQAGFDPAMPTAWSVEGLLRYLPAQAQDLLFERVHELSAVGSRVVANAPTEEAKDPQRVAREREMGQRLQAALGAQGTIAPLDVDGLSYAEERTDIIKWLADHGWEASSATVPEMAARYGRVSDSTDPERSVPSFFISGLRTR